jgi:lipopolysaccharide/colanic/teichoic acid biosynthesis glycosyltransferase
VLAEVPDVLTRLQIDEVLALSPDCGPALAVCTAAGIPLTFVPELPGSARRPERSTAPTPYARGALRLGTKRGLDIVIAALGLLVAAPLLALSALAIQLVSPGPVLRRQARCGLGGRRFTLYRLRSEETRPARRRGALRLRSGVGRFVHDSGVDDVPVLWNVLKGDMSLVGPRPSLPSEVARSSDTARRRLSMRPGLTCLWQLSPRARLQEDERTKLDLQYVDDWSLRTDLKILARTVPAVLRSACD